MDYTVHDVVMLREQSIIGDDEARELLRQLGLPLGGTAEIDRLTQELAEARELLRRTYLAGGGDDPEVEAVLNRLDTRAPAA